MSKAYHTIICFFLALSAWSQNDSLRVAHLLDSALLSPERSTTFLSHVKKIEYNNQSKHSVLSDVLALKVKFELRRGNFKQAKQIIQQALSKFKGNKAYGATFISLKGSVLASEREFQQAISYYQQALRIYDGLKMEREAAYVKNNIANVFFNLNDFESAYTYANASFATVYQLKDTSYYPQIAAILSISEAKTKRFTSALNHAKLAVSAGEQFRNPLAIILGKYALGDVYAQQNKWQKAKTEYEQVVSMTQQLRLVQYESFGRIGLLTVAIAQKQYNEAILQGEKALELSRMLGQKNADYTIFQQLSVAYHAIGNDSKAYSYLNQANQAFRSYNSIENKKAIQELLTKYETEKKERALSQKDLELSRAILWIVALLFVLSSLIALIFWIRKRNESRLLQLKMETISKENDAFIEGEQRERERIAADIHDGIASSLTGLALKIQQTASVPDVTMISEQIQQIRNEVRLVSKNILPFDLQSEGWNTAFQRVIDTVQSTQFQFYFLPDYTEQRLNNQKGMVLYRILQELVQNTLKHAEATECELLITEENDELLIQYSDNGKGVSDLAIQQGNGWQSIRLRVAALNGTLTFPQNPLGGFKIDIRIKL